MDTQETQKQKTEDTKRKDQTSQQQPGTAEQTVAGDMEELWVCCPFCGGYHLPDWFSNVELDKNKEGHLLSPDEYEAGGHARYVCPACKKPWTEKDRWRAVTNGKWPPAGCMVGKNGRIIGKVPITTNFSFRGHAMILPTEHMTINRMAKKWAEVILAKKMGDIGPLQDFYNSYLAKPFEEREKETSERRRRNGQELKRSAEEK